MDWLRLSLTGIFCFSFILMALYSAYAEIIFYLSHRATPGEHLTSRSKVTRRFFTSVILITVMVLIFVGVNFIKFTDPRNFLTFWGICTLFALFLFILPLIDIKETAQMGLERKKMLYKGITDTLNKERRE